MLGPSGRGKSTLLKPSLTAKENVALVTEIARDPMDPGEALEMVGLKERRDHFPAQLSGGEQQRVAIARAIAKRVIFISDGRIVNVKSNDHNVAACELKW